MHNIKRLHGTFKGRIGECMVKMLDKYLVLTNFLGKTWYLERHKGKFSPEQQQFLSTHWYSFDAIKLSYNNIYTLYEINMRNHYPNPKPHWKHTFTKASVDVYNKALALGFAVKVITVRLYDDWNYDLEITPFCPEQYFITEDNPAERLGSWFE